MTDCICLGTNLVVLTAAAGQDPSKREHLPPEGLLAVFEKRSSSPPNGNQSEEWPRLQIEVGTNQNVYRGEMDVSQVRLPEDQKREISHYLLGDGQEHPTITVRFQHSKDGRLELIIQQRLEKLGLQKTAYEGTLTTRAPEGSTNTKSSILQFCHKLGTAVNDSSKQIQSLEKDLRLKEEFLNQWKETAQALDKSVWQAEKDRLVNNFLKLWNERQARAKKQLQDLQAELDMTKAALSASKTGGKRKGRSLKLDEEITNALDQADLASPDEPVPMDQVEALAAGHRIPSSTATSRPILKSDETVSANTLKQQAEDYEKRKEATKKNQVTKKDVMEGGSDSETDDGGQVETPIHQTAAAAAAAAAETQPANSNTKDTQAPRPKFSLDDSDSSDDDDDDEQKPPAKKRVRTTKAPPKKKEPTQTSKGPSGSNRKATTPETPSAPTVRTRGDEPPELEAHSDDEDLRTQIRAQLQGGGDSKKNWSTTLSSSDED